MPSNEPLAALLARMGQMMDLLGEDSFRASAHTRAARAVEDAPIDLLAAARGADAMSALTALPGIGPGMAKKIIEFAATGRIAEADGLVAKCPRGLLQLLDIPSLGPKTVRMLWQQGGVTDLAGLKKIIADGSILQLPRMGAKAVERLSSSIAMLAESSQRLALGPATRAAEGVIAILKALPGVKDIAAAGSLRRGRDTIGDIDILVAADAKHAPAISEAFRAMPTVRKVLAAGETKSSIRMAVDLASRWDGSTDEDAAPSASSASAAPTGPSVQVDLRVIPPASWGAALLYFTGSKEHNVRLRQRALDMGLTLNEYGLFPLDQHESPPQTRGVKPVAAATEHELYAALKLPYLHPEIREDRGELAHAATPRLVELADIKAELHAHTTASDGRMSIEELARQAKARGFHTIAVTDHSQSSAIAGGLKPKALREHIRRVHEANDKVAGITILAGSEVDILADGSLDYDDELLAQLDVVVASPHAALSQDPVKATERLLKAIRHPLVHIIGHPTGRLVMRRAGLSPDVPALVAAAVECKTALEINTHWMRLDLRDTQVRTATDAGALIAIDSDVHEAADFDNLRFGVATARRGGVTPELCVNTWPAKKLHAWLKSKGR